jgi:DNA-directed RNA polymerase specialized sigma24 family protein
MTPPQSQLLTLIQCRTALVRFAQREGFSADDADDLAGEAWARAWLRRDQLANPQAYSFRVLRRLIADHVERTIPSVPFDDSIDSKAFDNSDPASRYDCSDDLFVATEAKAKLPARVRMHLDLWCKYGSHTIVASILNISPEASRQRLSRCRRTCRPLPISLLSQPHFTMHRDRVRAVAKVIGVSEQVVRYLCCEQDWADPDHQEWVNSASISEMADWVLANLEP